MKYYKVCYRNRKVYNIGVDEVDYVNEQRLAELDTDPDLTVRSKKEISDQEYERHQLPEMDFLS